MNSLGNQTEPLYDRSREFLFTEHKALRDEILALEERGMSMTTLWSTLRINIRNAGAAKYKTLTFQLVQKNWSTITMARIGHSQQSRRIWKRTEGLFTKARLKALSRTCNEESHSAMPCLAVVLNHWLRCTAASSRIRNRSRLKRYTQCQL